jgi:hypothetical protein
VVLVGSLHNFGHLGIDATFLSSGVLLCGSLSTCLASWNTWCVSEFRFGGDGDVWRVRLC